MLKLMKSYTDMIKCSIEKKCLDDSIFGALKIYEVRTLIVKCILNKQPVPDELIQAFYISYKAFSKFFFDKKTVKCMFDNCSKRMPTNLKLINNVLQRIEKLQENIANKKSTPLIRNYRKVLKVIIKITKDFGSKYEKKYLNRIGK